MPNPDPLSVPSPCAPAAAAPGRAATPAPSASLPPPPVPAAAAGTDLAWRVVGLANLYRLLLPPVLFALQLLTRPTPTVGASDPQLFIVICMLYWGLGE